MSDPITPAVEPAAPTAPVTPVAPVAGEPTKLPDDHPLVKAFNAQKTELVDAKKRLTDIDDANKTDAQKLADEIAELKKTNATLATDALRNKVAGEKGVPANLISGATQAELEAAADALLAFKGTSASALGGNQRPAGPVSGVTQTEETREDRRKRLEESLKR